MKRFFILLLCTLTISIPITAEAHTIEQPVASAADADIRPCANITGYKYKVENGKIYKRLWSYTYNRWEEPYWHLA